MKDKCYRLILAVVLLCSIIAFIAGCEDVTGYKAKGCVNSKKNSG